MGRWNTSADVINNLYRQQIHCINDVVSEPETAVSAKNAVNTVTQETRASQESVRDSISNMCLLDTD